MLGIDGHRPSLRVCINPNSYQMFVLDCSIRVDLAEFGYPLTLTVPKGFDTDLASIPRIVPIPKLGKHNLAAIVHDYLYRIKGDCDTYEFSRKDVDNLFYEMLKRAEVSRPFAILMWCAVRLGGASRWKR